MSKIKKNGDTVVVTPEKNIVESQSKEFKQELSNLIKDGAKKIVIDMQNVEMVDSSGISIFIAAQNSLKELSGVLELINVSGNICKLLKLTRLDKHFTVKGRGCTEK